jgi:hypothetical protein
MHPTQRAMAKHCVKEKFQENEKVKQKLVLRRKKGKGNMFSTLKHLPSDHSS